MNMIIFPISHWFWTCVSFKFHKVYEHVFPVHTIFGQIHPSKFTPLFGHHIILHTNAWTWSFKWSFVPEREKVSFFISSFHALISGQQLDRCNSQHILCLAWGAKGGPQLATLMYKWGTEKDKGWFLIGHIDVEWGTYKRRCAIGACITKNILCLKSPATQQPVQ